MQTIEDALYANHRGVKTFLLRFNCLKSHRKDLE